jgi:hypothetical protein
MASFDHDITSIMGHAFDLALHGGAQPEAIRELVAKQILRDTQNGERNPDVLANIAMEHLGLNRGTPSFAREATIELDKIELGIRLVKAFAKITLPHNQLALVGLAEQMTNTKTVIGRL